MELLAPLTILSIRGALLFVFGLFLIIIPGLYYSFKYELASFCFILEGWNEEATPIEHAEKIIGQYKSSLIPLAFLMLIEWLSSWLLGQSIKWINFPMTFSLRTVLAVFEAAITLFSNIYFTLIILHLLPSRSVKKIDRSFS